MDVNLVYGSTTNILYVYDLVRIFKNLYDFQTLVPSCEYCVYKTLVFWLISDLPTSFPTFHSFGQPVHVSNMDLTQHSPSHVSHSTSPFYKVIHLADMVFLT